MGLTSCHDEYTAMVRRKCRTDTDKCRRIIALLGVVDDGGFGRLADMDGIGLGMCWMCYGYELVLHVLLLYEARLYLYLNGDFALIFFLRLDLVYSRILQWNQTAIFSFVSHLVIQ